MSRKMPIPFWLVAVVLLVLLRYVAPALYPGAFIYGVIGGLVGALIILAWWMFASGRPWLERFGAVALMVTGLAITPRFLHLSIATGAQGALFYIHAIPLLGLVFLVWAMTTRGLDRTARLASMVATILLACGFWTLLRTGGIMGDGRSLFSFRWSETPEERLLASAEELPTAPVPAADAVPTEADWPGFRGPGRDSVVRGLRIATDWQTTPPVELWRRPIGPGWSSFAVAGDRLYTQEQRGDEEVVACYDARTGEPVWQHADAARFYESNGGAGPRGTPSLIDGRVYAFGATGILNVLDAASGAVIWSRDVGADSDTKIPGWGFASSPLVLDDVVVVAAAGNLVGYDRDTGEPQWQGERGGGGYSSPQAVSLHGIEQVLFQNGKGIVSVSPRDGSRLWEHAWPGFRIVQPAVIADGELLVNTSGDAGGIATRRLRVARDPEGWSIEELWTSNRLKPYFNDFVVHEDHAYGFDGRILACIDLEKGERQWKGGRYGHGQLLLLPEQDVLLVLSEDGELALVRAAPEGFEEIARVPAINGKTWNHPALVGDLLLVRNGEEMAAFRLTLGST